MNFTEILKIIAPIFIGFLSVGGIGAWFSYRGGRDKRAAEAKLVDSKVVVTFADGWQKYALKLEERMGEMEDRYEKRIKELEELIDKKDKDHAEVVRLKDVRIDELEERIIDLEKELDKYKKIQDQVDVAKEGLHHDVDNKLDTIKKVE